MLADHTNPDGNPMFSSIRKSLSFLAALSEGIARRHIGLIAAGVAFYSLLAIFPAITAVVTLWGFFADPAIVEQQLDDYETVVPDEAFAIIDAQVHAIANGPKQVLGWATAVSTLAALWASRAGVAAIIGGLNAVYRLPPRGGLRKQLAALLLTLLLIMVALVAMAVVVAIPIILHRLPLGPLTGFALDLARWSVAIGVVLLGIGLLYRFGPNRDAGPRRLVTTGSALAVGLWALVSWGFSNYLENFSNYNEVYGSLGAVIALLMWFYLSAFVVLLGALVDAELEQRRDERGSVEPASEDPSPATA